MNIKEHLITILAEEAGEVSKEGHKALRFGLGDRYPNPESPAQIENLIREMNDFLGAATMLVSRGILPPDWQDPEAQKRKVNKINDFLEYSRKAGTLQ